MGERKSSWLVIGYPSWIAKSLVREIAHGSDSATVRLLVPHEMGPDAETFIGGLRTLQSQVEIVEGDPVRVDLGLAGRTFNALAADLDFIANLYDVSPLAEAPARDGYGGLSAKSRSPEDLAVRAAREAIEIASATSRLRQLVHLGSLTVAGGHHGVWTEEDVSAGQRHRTLAERRRHHAERLLWRVRDRIPFTIVRTGVVLGDSRSGEIGWYHGPHDLVDLLLHGERLPHISGALGAAGALHPIPSDHLARLLRAVAESPPPRSGALHAAPASPITAAGLQVAVIAAAEALPGRHRREAPASLRKSLRRRYGSGPGAVLKTLTRVDTPAVCSIRRAQEVERSAGLKFPDLHDALPAIVAFALARAAADAETRIEDALDA